MAKEGGGGATRRARASLKDTVGPRDRAALRRQDPPAHTRARAHARTHTPCNVFQDYVTEKLFDMLAGGAVPVYRGAPNARHGAGAPN